MFEVRIAPSVQSNDDKKKRKTIEGVEDESMNAGTLQLFKKCLEPLGDMVDDVELCASSDGLKFQVTDTMRVAMADVFFPASLFDTYRCDRPITLGIKIKDLVKILKSGAGNEAALLMHAEDNAKNLNVIFESSSMTLDFKLKLFQFDTNMVNLRFQNFDAEIQMNVSEFIIAPKTVGSYAEFLQISCDENAVKFCQTGDLISANLALKTSSSGNKNTSIVVRRSTQKEIPIKYVNYLLKVAQMFNKISICLGERTPVYFELILPDDGYFRYYVAPKVEENNEE